jgi:hypothetical protein
MTTLATDAPNEKRYHVLPNLAVLDYPDVWQAVIATLMQRGLTREEALVRVRFAYTGSFSGQLPPGCV